MTRINGRPIVLIDKQVIGKDSFGHPKTADVEIEVENVLIAPATTEDITNQINLTGKKLSILSLFLKGICTTGRTRKFDFWPTMENGWRAFGRA